MRSGFGNSLSRPRPSASRMRFSSAAEYPFAFRFPSLCPPHSEYYIRSTSAGLLQRFSFQQSTNVLADLFQVVSEFHFCLLLADAIPALNFLPGIFLLPPLTPLPLHSFPP